MKDQVWVQCQTCGKLHQVKRKHTSLSDDDLYTEPIWCPRCRDSIKHLMIGENEEDIYIFGNNNLDERIFIY